MVNSLALEASALAAVSVRVRPRVPQEHDNMTKHTYSSDDLSTAIKESITWAEVCRKLKVKPSTGSQTHLKSRAIRESMDFSHFKGKLYNKGTKLPHKRNPLSDYFNNVKKINSHTLRIRLIEEGYKENKCEHCGNSEWMGQNIPLELDHIDSNHWNNELSNLQILCANCHSIVTKQRRSHRRTEEKTKNMGS